MATFTGSFLNETITPTFVSPTVLTFPISFPPFFFTRPTSAADFIDGGGGNDFINGGGGADTVFGGTGNDTITGGSGAGAQVFGGDGDDLIFQVNGTPEFIDGGNGIDTLNTTAFAGNYSVNLVNGLTNFGGELFLNMENLISGIGNDTLTGTAGNNLIDGGAGNDLINGGGGNDTVFGGTGNDTLTGGSGFGAAVFGGDGDDLIFQVNGTPEFINGGNGVDTLNTTAFAGNYSVNLTTGATNFAGESFLAMENLISGIGNDTLTGTAGNNLIDGGAGNDLINGGGGNDTVFGGTGNDTLTGGSGAGAAVFGGTGDDLIFQVNGTPEFIDGGTGVDTLNTTAFTGNYAVNLATGATNFAGEAFVNMENLISGIGNDTLTGTAGNNFIDGGGGNDTIFGDNGNDTLSGSTGDDTMFGGFGNDTISGGAGNDFLGGGTGFDFMDGGLGNDTYVVDSIVDTVTEAFGGAVGGVDTVEASVTLPPLGANVENLTLTGVAAISGSGNGLNNVITGNNAANVLQGFAGFDTLIGNGGNDTLVGGDQGDLLSGGVGADVFDFNLVSHSTGGVGRDTIQGFDGAGVAGGDRIDLSTIDANALTGFNDTFILGGVGNGHVSLVNSGTLTIVRANVDADAAFEFQLAIDDGAGVFAADYNSGDFIL